MPTVETNKLSPRIQAGIAVGLLLMFAGIMFLPAVIPSFAVESDTKQTLFTLVTAVVFFFIGKNTDTASREAAITAAAIAPIAQPAGTVVTTTTPATTIESKTT